MTWLDKLFHKHNWQTRGMQNHTRRRPQYVAGVEFWDNPVESDVTIALQSCTQCGDLRTVELSGHWEEEYQRVNISRS